jgi:hypothetical protein
MKASKKVVRQKQRQASSKIRESKYNIIMESAEFNQHLFYKLIREQRSTGQTDTDIIVIDDMILNTGEMILNRWNAHFERLSTPVLKKEKDPKIAGHYRGIAVTPVLSMILETLREKAYGTYLFRNSKPVATRIY